MKPIVQKIISELIEKIAVKAVYIIPSEKEKQLFLVIKNETEPKQKPIPVNEIFQDYPQYSYRIYDESYAVEQFKEGNIFFIHTLSEDFLTYRAPKTLQPDLNFKEAFKNAADFFNKEHHKALDFQEGVHFYMEKANYAQAAFMLHQAIELAFRTVELITMGKEKVCHGIVHHQKYIQNFVPELGELFTEENINEIHLLQLLDTAYRDVRYDRGYAISSESIEYLQSKLKPLLELVEKEFTKRYEYCKNALKKISSEKELSREEIAQSLKKFLNNKYHKTNTHSGSSYFKTDIIVEDPLDNFFTLANLLKVCVLAIEHTDEYFSTVIPQPYVNIQHTLEFAIQLLPYEEMEFFEQIIDSYGGLEALLKKENQL